MGSCPGNGTTDDCTHTWGKWTLTTHPTALPITGVETRICSKCSTSETQNLTEQNYKAYFIGEWINTVGRLTGGSVTSSGWPPYTLEISMDYMRFEDVDGDFIQFTDLIWTAALNPATGLASDGDRNTPTIFPIGFTLNGTRTSARYGTTEPSFVALNQTGLLFITHANVNNPVQQIIFTKGD